MVALICCGSFAPFKLYTFLFLCNFSLCCSLSFIFPFPTQPHFPCHLLQAQCLQQCECQILVLPHYSTTTLLQHQFLNSFLTQFYQLQCLCLFLHNALSFCLNPSFLFLYYYNVNIMN